MIQIPALERNGMVLERSFGIFIYKLHLVLQYPVFNQRLSLGDVCEPTHATEQRELYAETAVPRSVQRLHI